MKILLGPLFFVGSSSLVGRSLAVWQRLACCLPAVSYPSETQARLPLRVSLAVRHEQMTDSVQGMCVGDSSEPASGAPTDWGAELCPPGPWPTGLDMSRERKHVTGETTESPRSVT